MSSFTPEQIQEILDLYFENFAHRQYIGARYVPIFGRKDEDSIEWDSTGTYEPLTIVLYQGNSYTSRQFVPVGVDITNETYWAVTGNYNAQIELYRQSVLQLDSKLPGTEFDSTNTIKKYIDDTVTNLNEDISDINSEIDTLKTLNNSMPFYKPEWTKVADLEIPDTDYFQALEYLNGVLYTTSSTRGTREKAYLRSYNLVNYEIMNSIEIDDAAEAGHACYYNSLSKIKDNYLLTTPYLNTRYLYVLNPLTGETIKSGVCNINLSGACASSDNTIFVNPWGSENFEILRATETGNFLECAGFKNTGFISSVRADMCSPTTGLLWAITTSSEYSTFINIFNSAGYLQGTILCPDVSILRTGEAQGITYNSIDNSIYILYADGELFKCVAPYYSTHIFNSLNSHTRNYSNLDIHGYIVAIPINDATPNIPYKFEMSMAKTVVDNNSVGMHFRAYGWPRDFYYASSTSAPISIKILHKGTNPPFTDLYYFTYSINSNGTFTLTNIYDIVNSQNYSISSIEDYTQVLQTLNIPNNIRGGYYGYTGASTQQVNWAQYPPLNVTNL